MAAPNLFEELKTALTDFNTFLQANRATIKPAIAPLNQLTGGRVTELINSLIDLMNKLKTEVERLDPNVIPALGQVTQFTQGIKTLLEASRNLLPNETSTINDIIGVADVVTSLPSIQQLKTEITTLITNIIGHLNFLKS
jgi:hypothetical protein